MRTLYNVYTAVACAVATAVHLADYMCQPAYAVHSAGTNIQNIDRIPTKSQITNIYFLYTTQSSIGTSCDL